MKRNIVFISIICFIRLNLLSQNIQYDFEKINETYINIPYLEANIEYLITSWMDTISEQSAYFIKQENLLYYKIDQIEMLQDTSVLIVIDHLDKNITVGKASTLFLKNKVLQTNLDQFLSSCIKSEFSRIDSVNSAYQIIFNVSPPHEVRIFFNSKLFLLNKIEYRFNESDNISVADIDDEHYKAFIEYRNVNLKKSKKLDLSISNYVNKKKNKMVPAPLYKNYSITEQN